MGAPTASPTIDSELSRDGFARLFLFDAERCARLTEIWRVFAARHCGGFSSTVLIDDAGMRTDIHRALLPDVEAATKAALSDYRVVFCGFVNKDPGSTMLMPLHQDITMTDESRRPAISLWAPLIDVDAANGCLVIVPGSHRLNSAPRAPGTPFAAAAVETSLHRDYVRPLALGAGEAALMDQRLFHGSGGNGACRDRPVVAAVLVPRGQSHVYYHRQPGEPVAELEGFEVADDFLLQHRLGTRPTSGRSLGSTPETAEPISPARLAEVLGGASRHVATDMQEPLVSP